MTHYMNFQEIDRLTGYQKPHFTAKESTVTLTVTDIKSN